MSATAKFKLGVDSGIKVKCNSPDEAFVRGLNKLGYPDLDRDTVQPMEFGAAVDIEKTTSAKYGRIVFSGNALSDDLTGQDILRDYWLNNTEISDMRLYEDQLNFATVDLANDPTACFQMKRIGGKESDKNGIYSYSGEMVVGGRIAYFSKHMVDTATPTLAFVADGGSGATITDSDSGFVTAGFKAGMTMIIEKSTSNDKQVLIESVAAGVITLAAGFSLTSEASIEGCTLHGGTF